jgi:tryptophan halogenase
VDGVPLPQYWFHLTGGRADPVDYACFREPVLMDALRAPKSFDGRCVVPHAWHFDADLVADFLKRWSVDGGVAHIQDDVREVSVNEQGRIESVTTKTGRQLRADLYVDCTGPRRVLIGKALAEPFVDMSGYLPCDSVVSAAVPNDDNANGIEPYTSAIAMSAGWAWKIPLLTRFGSGYVYSSKFTDADQAVRDFCRLWDVDESRLEFNETRFRTGRNRRAWVGNCVSIGRSSCFLEPLESTDIYFITASICQLAKHFPTRGMDERLIDRFNWEIQFMFDDCRDFVQAHYLASSRDDSPFWLANRNELTVSDDIREKIEVYRCGLPVNPPLSNEEDYYGSFDNEFRNLWTNDSYYCIFAGMGLLPDRPLGRLSYRPEAIAKARQVFARIREQQDELLQSLPSTVEYLQRLHEKSGFGERIPVTRHHAVVF